MPTYHQDSSLVTDPSPWMSLLQLPLRTSKFNVHLDGLGSFETDIIPWKDPRAWICANTDHIVLHASAYRALSHSEDDELAVIFFQTTPIYQVN